MTKESNSRKLAGDPQLTGESGQRNFQLPTPAQERGARILTWVFAMATLLGLILTVMQWLAVISGPSQMSMGSRVRGGVSERVLWGLGRGRGLQDG